MTVAELIEKLRIFDGTLPVRLYNTETCRHFGIAEVNFTNLWLNSDWIQQENAIVEIKCYGRS